MASTYLYFVFTLLQSWTNAYQKSIILNNTNLGASGIGVNIYADHVDTINNQWHLDPISQETVDIELHMNHEWGFHPTLTSSISIALHGSSPNTTSLSGGEMLLLFSVANQQYLSIAMSFNDRNSWKIYPDPTRSSLAFSNDIFTEIITNSIESRSDRISNHNQWVEVNQMDESNVYSQPLEWPLTLSITNDPRQNMMQFQNSEWIQSENDQNVENQIVEFNSSFATNQGLSVYLMNNRSESSDPLHRSPFIISSMEVHYEYTTDSPTMSPTVPPSSSTSTASPLSNDQSHPNLSISGPSTTLYREHNNPIPSTTTSTLSTLWKHSNSQNEETQNISPSIYLMIIAILSAMLCIVTSLLILIVIRSRRATKVAKEGFMHSLPGHNSSSSALPVSMNRNQHILRDLEPTDTDHDSLYGPGPGLQSPSKLTPLTPSQLRNVVNISPFKKREILSVIAQNESEGVNESLGTITTLSFPDHTLNHELIGRVCDHL